MPNIKIYGLRSTLYPRRKQISKAIHASVMDALNYPPEKKFHRFIYLDDGDFIFPDDRSDNLTMIEILMFAGRTMETRKDLIRQLYSSIEGQAGISPQDVEITIIEQPKENWGIRGYPGDEIKLDYKVEI